MFFIKALLIKYNKFHQNTLLLRDFNRSIVIWQHLKLSLKKLKGSQYY